MKSRNYHTKAIILCVLYYIKKLITLLGKFFLIIALVCGLEYGVAKMISPNDNTMHSIFAMMFIANCIALFVVAVLAIAEMLETISASNGLIYVIDDFCRYFKINTEYLESMLKRNKDVKLLLKEFLYANFRIYRAWWDY